MFYKAMKMCGTDFDMMAGLFPTRTHRHLKVRVTAGPAPDKRRDWLKARPQAQSIFAHKRLPAIPGMYGRTNTWQKTSETEKRCIKH